MTRPVLFAETMPCGCQIWFDGAIHVEPCGDKEHREMLENAFAKAAEKLGGRMIQPVGGGSGRLTHPDFVGALEEKP